MKITSTSCLIAALLALSGCATEGPKDTVGSLAVPPASGPAPRAPAKTPQIPGGPYLGAFTGSDVGKQLDEKDKSEAAKAEFEALETGAAGTAHEWRNLISGHGGSVTPGQAYSVNDYSCRDYVHKLVLGDRTETVRGTACKQPDGSWRPLT